MRQDDMVLARAASIRAAACHLPGAFFRHLVQVVEEAFVDADCIGMSKQMNKLALIIAVSSQFERIPNVDHSHVGVDEKIGRRGAPPESNVDLFVHARHQKKKDCIGEKIGAKQATEQTKNKEQINETQR